MSKEILSNPSSLEGLRIRFLCILYFRTEYKKLAGMTPKEIFVYVQTHRDPNTNNPPDNYTDVIEKLVEMNIEKGIIKLENGICYLTNFGRGWAKNNCSRTAYSIKLLE